MDKTALVRRFAECEDDKVLLSHILDKASGCANQNIPTSVGFLDPRIQAIVYRLLPRLPAQGKLWGGYPDAERRMLFFLPDYMEEPNTEEIQIVHAMHRDPKPPSHRDYLGSALGMGIKRDGIGDILVANDGAQLFVRAALCPFFLSNFISAGRVHLQTEVLPVSAFVMPESAPVYKTASLSSLRADAVIAAAYGVSRSAASEAIASGRVFCNNLLLSKGDKPVKVGDKLKWQGKGRFFLESAGGTSRKGRLFVTMRF